MAKINNKAQVANNSNESAQENVKKLYDWLKAENYDVEIVKNSILARLDTDYFGADVEIFFDVDKVWHIDKIELDDNSLDTDALDSLNHEVDRLKDNIRYYNENDMGK